MALRTLGMFGLGATFLAISPPLRASLMDELTSLNLFVEDCGLWSYTALALAALATAMLWVHHTSRSR